MKKDNERGSDMLPQMLSGAVAGLVSRVISAPLDVLKIRFQLQDSNKPKYSSLKHAVRKIIQEEGILGLWKGNVPAVYLWVSYSAIQFMVYGEMKRYGDTVVTSLGMCESNTSAHAAVNFMSGAASGIVATTFTYPFDIMRTQFAIQGDRMVHPSMLQYARHTYAQMKFAGFFHGLPASVVGIVPFMGLNFTIYEFLKAKGQSYYQSQQFSSSAQPGVLSTNACLMLVSGMAGGMAGGVSKLTVYPFDTMKKRMQAQALVNTFQEDSKINVNSLSAKSARGDVMTGVVREDYSSLRRCFRTIIRTEGLLAFYKGIVPTVAKSVVSTAVTFYVYEGCYLALKALDSTPESASGTSTTRTRRTE